jgi:hypothetical protein
MNLQEDDTESPRGTLGAWSPCVTSSALARVAHERTRTEQRPHLLFRRCTQGRKHGVTPAHRSEECTQERSILVTFADFAREAQRVGWTKDRVLTYVKAWWEAGRNKPGLSVYESAEDFVTRLFGPAYARNIVVYRRLLRLYAGWTDMEQRAERKRVADELRREYARFDPRWPLMSAIFEDAPRVCACGCGRALTGRGDQKYATGKCRNTASHRKVRRAQQAA